MLSRHEWQLPFSKNRADELTKTVHEQADADTHTSRRWPCSHLTPESADYPKTEHSLKDGRQQSTVRWVKRAQDPPPAPRYKASQSLIQFNGLSPRHRGYLTTRECPCETSQHKVTPPTLGLPRTGALVYGLLAQPELPDLSFSFGPQTQASRSTCSSNKTLLSANGIPP